MTERKAPVSIWKQLKSAPGLELIFRGIFRVLHQWEGHRVRQLRQRYRQQKQSLSIGPRVLVVSRSGIGNLVEATPLIQAIRLYWPQAWITLLTAGGDLLEDWCIPDRIVTSPEELDTQSFDHTFFTCWGYRGVPHITLPCKTGITHSIRLVLDKWFVKPEREINMDMLRRVGYRGTAPPLYVSMLRPTEWTFPASQTFCILACGRAAAPWKAKRWPFYAELSLRLLDQYSESAILFLGTREDEFPEELHDTPRVYDLRDRFTLRQTAWVLKHSALAIGNDCGPMHIADAVQTPGVVLFGPTCELKNGPMNKIRVIRSEPSCEPCQYTGNMKQCEESQCMKQISVQTILDGIRPILA